MEIFPNSQYCQTQSQRVSLIINSSNHPTKTQPPHNRHPTHPSLQGFELKGGLKILFTPHLLPPISECVLLSIMFLDLSVYYKYVL